MVTLTAASFADVDAALPAVVEASKRADAGTSLLVATLQNGDTFAIATSEHFHRPNVLEARCVLRGVRHPTSGSAAWITQYVSPEFLLGVDNVTAVIHGFAEEQAQEMRAREPSVS